MGKFFIKFSGMSLTSRVIHNNSIQYKKHLIYTEIREKTFKNKITIK